MWPGIWRIWKVRLEPKGSRDDDGGVCGKERKTRQESYISVEGMSEPTIHKAVESKTSREPSRLMYC
jgi:hypothetical protein